MDCKRSSLVSECIARTPEDRHEMLETIRELIAMKVKEIEAALKKKGSRR